MSKPANDSLAKRISSPKESTPLRERILRFALSEFMHKGVKNVKVDHIASDLQISKRTLYEMFADKEELLVECLRWNSQQMKQRMETIAATADNPLEVYVRVFNLKMAEIRNTNPAFFSEAHRYEKAENFFQTEKRKRKADSQRFTALCVEAGLLRPDVNYELLGELFDLVGQTVMQYEFYRRFSMEELARTMNDTLFRGLCTARGQEILDNNLKL